MQHADPLGSRRWRGLGWGLLCFGDRDDVFFAFAAQAPSGSWQPVLRGRLDSCINLAGAARRRAQRGRSELHTGLWRMEAGTFQRSHVLGFPTLRGSPNGVAPISPAGRCRVAETLRRAPASLLNTGALACL